MRIQLVAHPLLGAVVMLGERANRCVVKTKIRPELLSDPVEDIFLLGYLKLSAAPKAFVSLYASKKSVPFDDSGETFWARNRFFCA